ncbi:MAG: mechanosensitive ion channel, partial [Planctomycetes bacterium]|nr:mechanosensitive ion channel [Planctomycetota bacterium]
ALQGTLSNFAAGLMILMYRPYDIGHLITAAGMTGTVKAMTLVSTTLRLGDNQRVVIPNGKIWGDVITNVSGQTTRRVDMKFGCGYDDDLQKVQAVLEEIINNHPKVLKDPEPVIKVHELGDSSVNFVVRPWANSADYWEIYWDVTRKVKERFDEEGLSIPFPQRDVHLHQVEA